jgi:4-hydroxy-tetrahydrodipicolinate synthase
MELTGCGTALVTPFRRDGELDLRALERLVELQIEGGIDFLVPVGSTGEAATLTQPETLSVVETVVAAARGRVLIFAGCTHNATREAIARARALARIPGLTGLLTANPYYNRPSQEGQYLHFRAIAEAVDLPILLYNIPTRTGANLESATVLRLAEIPNIIGIKEASGMLNQVTELLTQAPSTFRVLSGDDGLTLPILALGGVGLVSVASNVIPAQVTQIVHSALASDWPAARALNRRFYRLMQGLYWEPNPAPVKAVLALLGHCEDHLRLPMLPVTAPTRRRLEALIGELGLSANAAPIVESARVS